MEMQVQVLKEVADDIGTHIHFPLATMIILAEGSKEITKILYSQLLPSGGANCHFPLVYCHAPLTFFGLTLPQVICMQLIKQVKRVMVHGALQTHTGKYFNISLEQAQLEVRIGTPTFEASYKDNGFLLMFYDRNCTISSRYSVGVY
jgi:hypothetical protein